MNTEIALVKLKGIAERPRLEAFLMLSDGWTTPALSQRVDLSSFAEKILQNGTAFMAVTAVNRDIGVAAFYSNESIRHRAYLTHLAVNPEYQNRGVGKALLDETREFSKSKGMTSMLLEVYRSNETARRFYASCGFTETEIEGDKSGNSIHMVCSL